MNHRTDGTTSATRQAPGRPLMTGHFATALPVRAGRRLLVAGPDALRGRNPKGAPVASRTLRPAQAATWRAAESGILLITHGRLWATRTGAGPYHLDARGGDHFLDAGDRLTLSAGEEWLLEALPVRHADAAVFSWTPVPPLSSTVPVSWRADVLVPLDELGRALRQAAQSALHLASGLVRAMFAILNIARHALFVRARGRFDTQFGNTPAG